ncbi:MAG: SpoIIIAH-like family protein [Clostridiales bacterium]|jgi:stage III sporulation protein AH|nr:SpoIIIAH-like family protein [Clostridiales bacterium]
MFVLKRNQIIITALVVMVAVAGYLNYVDTKNSPVGIALNDEGEALALIPNGEGRESAPVSALGELYSDINEYDDPAIAADENKSDQTDPGAAVFVNASPADSSYFIQAKLDREQSRSRQKEMLSEMINNPNIEQVKRSECASEMLEIQKRIEKETAAEAMIESKGFTDVYVRIDDDTVDVVVSKERLSDAEIAQIEDIVKRKTGVSADKIRINPMKKQ